MRRRHRVSGKRRLLEVLRSLHIRRHSQFAKDVHAGDLTRTPAQRRIERAIERVERLVRK
jgi:hypothetical protein